MPKDNQRDLPDIPEPIRNTMKLHFVDSMDDVLRIALEREIVALSIPADVPAVDIATRVVIEENRAH
jgi:ATP-dependent Lon protease